ncbi:hypothetical protein FRC03_001493 [Tulasnella sp. 419]|nr:hypothetical protein FRC03_001493 [Tulasnella sp. 419]
MSDVERHKSKSKHKSHSKSSSRKESGDDKEHWHKKHSKRDRDHSDDEDRHKRHKHHRRVKEKKKRADSNGMDIVDEDGDGAMWVEKDITMEGEHPVATEIPTAESLNLNSHASQTTSAVLPPPVTAESKLQRDEWMLLPEAKPTANVIPSVSSRLLNTLDQSLTEDYGEPEGDKRTLGGGVDFFSSLGTERKKKPKEDKPDPEKLHVSHLELNTQLKEGKHLDEYSTPAPPKPITPGGPGSQWRMMKLKRTYETAEEEGRRVEDVALERYGTLEAFEEAKEERRILDERAERKAGRGGDGARRRDRDRDGDNEKGKERYMFTDTGSDSRPPSRASFRKPGTSGESGPSTPQNAPATPSYFNQAHTAGTAPATKRLDALRGQHTPKTGSPMNSVPNTKASTPIPSVMAPVAAGNRRALSPSSLNRLQAKVLRAKLMGQADAEELEKKFEEEMRLAQSGGAALVEENADGKKVEVHVLPTLDVRGRMYDVGQGQSGDDDVRAPGNRKKKEKVETRDPKTGEIIRYNADDDTTTLGEMLRQERFGAGMADQKNMDIELAGAIMRDGKFEDDLEYMDDNAEKLGRKKMRTDAMKRQFAINDYARTQKALASCQFCYGEDDSPPRAAVIAMGTRVYLSCTLHEDLVDGHCYIVPIQHHLSMLEGDDDVWEEVKNFMKCLMQMFADQNKGVIFYETVLNLKWQKHTFIECVPVPFDLFADLPAYFKESILASESEWSQHKKLIDFSARPGGFRRAMVPNLPYFMVQWDYKGEKGYGHVIEGTGDDAGAGDGDGAVDEGDKGGGEFPRYFAAEIIGNMLDLEPRKWRRPRKIDLKLNRDRVAKFKTKYASYDWTHLIGKS